MEGLTLLGLHLLLEWWAASSRYIVGGNTRFSNSTGYKDQQGHGRQTMPIEYSAIGLHVDVILATV